MAITPSGFKSSYPEFVATDNETIQAQIDVYYLIYQGEYGSLADHLAGLYVAHQLTVFDSNTSAQPVQNVTSRTIDNLSWSYQKSSSSDKAGDFASTKYGLEFYRIISMFGSGPIVAGAHL